MIRRRAKALALMLSFATGTATRLGAQEPLTASRCVDPAHVLPEFGGDTVQRLLAGEPQVRTFPIADRHWPQLCIYQLVSGRPADGAAAFTDYASRPAWVPRVVSAEIVSGGADTSTMRVAYRLRLPFRLTEIDTLAESIRAVTTANGEGCALSWHMLTSTRAEAIDGRALFLPWRSADASTLTLLVYELAAEPGNGIVKRIGVGTGIAAAKDVVKAVSARVAEELARDPRLLERQREVLARRSECR